MDKDNNLSIYILNGKSNFSIKCFLVSYTEQKKTGKQNVEAFAFNLTLSKSQNKDRSEQCVVIYSEN